MLWSVRPLISSIVVQIKVQPIQMNKIKMQHSNIAKSTKRYLFWCVNEHIDFRVPEFKSIASILKIPLKWVEKPREDPYMILDMESEKDAKQLVSRCMLVRACYELWGDGRSEEEFHANIKQQPASLIRPHLSHDKPFAVRVEGFNKTLRSTDKVKKIEALSYLAFDGPVNLKNPVTKLHLIEYYGLSNVLVPENPYRRFLGRFVAEGGRDLIARYSLKQRSYIGSTSMDAQLAFIMANLALVRENSLVLDPFVGTGSVLVSAAHNGAYILGSDIDFLTLHARTKPTRVKQVERRADESIYSNLAQYGLAHQYVDMAVVDCARTAWRTGPMLDAIITDPPYGIREATARVGKLPGLDREQSVQQKKQKRKQRQQHDKTSNNIVSNGCSEEDIASDVECRLASSTNNTQNDTAVTLQKESRLSSDRENDTILATNSLSSEKDDIVRPISPVTVQNGDDNTGRLSPTRIDTSRGDNRLLNSGSAPVHYPSKVTYSLSDVFQDLLNFAAQNLVVGGHLVFWLPVNRDDYDSSLVPHHPCLELRYNIEQVLNAHSSRRLITLRKTRAPQPGDVATADVDELTSSFREKFFIAAKMGREERMARKVNFTRDKRGQSLSHRTTAPAPGEGECSTSPQEDTGNTEIGSEKGDCSTSSSDTGDTAIGSGNVDCAALSNSQDAATTQHDTNNKPPVALDDTTTSQENASKVLYGYYTDEDEVVDAGR